jgi:transposase
MLALTPQHRLLLAVNPVDFRCAIDGLAAICTQQLKEQPDSGTVFVFTNKKRAAVKILVYDGQGYWLCMKRFSQGKLQWWPTSDANVHAISAQELNVLLHQGIPSKANMLPAWKPLAMPSYAHQAAC